MPEVLVLDPWDAYRCNARVNPSQYIAVRKITSQPEFITSANSRADPAHAAIQPVFGAAELRDVAVANVDAPLPFTQGIAWPWTLPYLNQDWTMRGDRAASWQIAKIGNDGMRFELRAGDRSSVNDTNIGPRHRCELIAKPYPLSFGVAYWWYEQKTFDWHGDMHSAAYCNIGQLHNTNDPEDTAGQSPIWAERLDPHPITGKTALIVRLRYSLDNPATENSMLDAGEPGGYIVIPEVDKNAAYHMLRRIVVDATGSSGRFEMWMRRVDSAGELVKVVDYSGQIGTIDNIGPYYHFGIYEKVPIQPNGWVVAEFRKHVIPTTADLSSYITSPPTPVTP